MLGRTPLNLLLVTLLIGAVVAGLVRIGSVVGQDIATPPADADAKIANAMTAAPASISASATILDNELDSTGKFIVLREGDNGWFCFPDAPATPSDDPQCLDQTWLDWLYAFVAGEEPNVTVTGLAYMLQGGTDPSNTDPFAAAPAPGEEWIASPPHVMILVPGELDPTMYSTDHDSGEPYIMWAGTPYEHIMMPVADHEHEI